MVEPLKLVFKPGINRETTNYGNTGGYYDGNMVRFKNGTPESIGGWVRYTSSAMLGTARSLFAWSILDGGQFYSSGTSWKYYLIYGVTPIDITPIRRTVTLGVTPLHTVNGTKLITVTDAAHGAVPHDFVTFSGASAVGGVPAVDINMEHQIVSVPTANTYTISVATTATSTANGGGTVQAVYQINVGLDTTVQGNGWGTGPWNGTEGWGEGTDTSVETEQLRLWYEDNFGQDLLYNVRNGGIYYKDMSGPLHTPGVNITTLGTGPSIATQVLVSDTDRHVLAFGANPEDAAAQDPLLVRWSASEDLTDWVDNTTNTAGSLRFDGGSRHVRTMETTTEMLVFTDATLHSMRYIGPPYTFGQTRIATNIKLIGPNAVASTGSITAWMAAGRFQWYDGVVQDMPCWVRSYVFSILNTSQTGKIVAGVNRQFSEFIWLMPVNGSSENNFYVVCNFENPSDLQWYYGDFNGAGRTAWLDAYFLSTPLATAPDGYIYAHDSGATDGSVSPAAILAAYLESSVFELAEGANFSEVTRHIPDFSFDGSTAISPAITVSFLKRDYPGSPFVAGPNGSVVETTVNEYTTKNDVRFRSRSIAYRIDTAEAGTLWQQGTPRLVVTPSWQR